MDTLNQIKVALLSGEIKSLRDGATNAESGFSQIPVEPASFAEWNLDEARAAVQAAQRQLNEALFYLTEVIES